MVQITGAESVPLGTLDRYEETHPMDVGLIKVDIEGTEQSFFARGSQNNRKIQACIVDEYLS